MKLAKTKINRKEHARSTLKKAFRLFTESEEAVKTSIKAYIAACIEIRDGYSESIYGTIQRYMEVLSEESAILGQPRSSRTFHDCWCIAKAIEEKRVTQEQLVVLQSRNEIIRAIPPKTSTKTPGWTPPDFVSLRVTRKVHDTLSKIAKQNSQTLNGVIEGLLGLSRKAKKKAA